MIPGGVRRPQYLSEANAFLSGSTASIPIATSTFSNYLYGHDKSYTIQDKDDDEDCWADDVDELGDGVRPYTNMNLDGILLPQGTDDTEDADNFDNDFSNQEKLPGDDNSSFLMTVGQCDPLMLGPRISLRSSSNSCRVTRE